MPKNWDPLMALPFWWLSFVSDLDVALGVCIVRGEDLIHATTRAHELGINPGGQVLGFEVPDD